MLPVLLWEETNENEKKPILFGHYLKGLTIKIVESKFVLVLCVQVIFSKTTSNKTTCSKKGGEKMLCWLEDAPRCLGFPSLHQRENTVLFSLRITLIHLPSSPSVVLVNFEETVQFKLLLA